MRKIISISLPFLIFSVHKHWFDVCLAFPVYTRRCSLQKRCRSNLVRNRVIVHSKVEKEEDIEVIVFVADKVDFFKSLVRKLASLSLEVYKWLSDVYKSDEANRMMEESLARIQGEEASYLRPMDAVEEKRGPLGRAEKNAVAWLSSVVEGEGNRARRIAEGEGSLVRPMDTNNGGPLAELEKQAVSFFKKIADSESERFSLGKLRPMELEGAKRSFLGDAEAMAVSAINDLTESELSRMRLSRSVGSVVRPIDVPGPLGEIEKAVADIIFAEKQRVKDRKDNKGKIVRPKDASVSGPLGRAEQGVVQVINTLKVEEQARLKSIRRILQKNRPMEQERLSLLGLIESFLVGLLKAPELLSRVLNRVKELLQSEQLVKEQIIKPSKDFINDRKPQ